MSGTYRTNIYNTLIYPNMQKANTFDNESKTGVIVDIVDNNNKDILYGYIPINSVTLNLNNNGELCNGSFSLIQTDETDDEYNSEIIPNFTKIMMIPNAAGDNYQFLFDEDGKPKNAIEAVISNGNFSIKGNGEVKVFSHAYSFVEPIYLTRYKYVGTHSHTNMTDITIQYARDDSKIHFVKSPTNLYSILKRELELAGVRTDKEDTTWDKKICIKDVELLKASCVGINESFTNATLYDVLIKIGNYLNRVPKLYFNPYYNANNDGDDYKEFLLFFEKKTDDIHFYDFDDWKSEINICGYSESNNQGKDAGTIVCDVKNIKSTNGTWHPYKGGFLPPTGEETEFNLTANSNLSIKTPKPIGEVIELWLMEVIIHDLTTQYSLKRTIKKVNCVSYEEWLTLSQNDRKITFYFNEGDNKINLPQNYNPSVDSSIFYGDESTKNYLFCVNYIPKLDMKMSATHNNKYEQIINQSDASVDSNSFNIFLENYAKENNNTDINIAAIYTDYTEIQQCGYRFIKGNDEYYINSINIVFSNNYYNVTYSLTKNNPKRSEIVSSSNIKNIYAIDSSQIVDREDEIVENELLIELSTEKNNNLLNTKYINNLKINNLFGFKQNPFAAYAKVDYMPNGLDDGTTYPSNYFKFINSLTLSKNNLIVNISALNNRSILIGGGLFNDGNFKYDHGSWGTSANIFSNYTDGFGCVEKISFKIATDLESNLKLVDNDSITYRTSVERQQLNDFYDNFIIATKNFPKISQSTYEGLDEVIEINNYRILKDTYEKLNISYRIPIKPKNKNTFIKDELLQFMIGNKSEDGLYLILDPKCEIDSDDTYATLYGDRVLMTIDSIDSTENGVKITFDSACLQFIPNASSAQVALCYTENNKPYKMLICSTIEFGNTVNNKLYLELH